MRYLVIDPTVSGIPFGAFNSEAEAKSFIADREFSSAGVIPEDHLDPELRVEKALVQQDGVWVRS